MNTFVLFFLLPFNCTKDQPSLMAAFYIYKTALCHYNQLIRNFAPSTVPSLFVTNHLPSLMADNPKYLYIPTTVTRFYFSCTLRAFGGVI